MISSATAYPRASLPAKWWYKWKYDPIRQPAFLKAALFTLTACCVVLADSGKCADWLGEARLVNGFTPDMRE
jgi:hypothetical protein